jgi:hypothetical protein
LNHVFFASSTDDAAWIDEHPLEDVYSRFRTSSLSLPLNWRERSILRRAWTENRVRSVGALLRPTLLLSTVYPAEIEYRRTLTTYFSRLLERGLEDEVRGICSSNTRPASSLCSIGYTEFEEYFCGRESLSDVGERVIVNTLRYAKQQESWLRTLPGITRVRTVDDASGLVQSFLTA